MWTRRCQWFPSFTRRRRRRCFVPSLALDKEAFSRRDVLEPGVLAVVESRHVAVQACSAGEGRVHVGCFVALHGIVGAERRTQRRGTLKKGTLAAPTMAVRELEVLFYLWVGQADWSRAMAAWFVLVITWSSTLFDGAVHVYLTLHDSGLAAVLSDDFLLNECLSKKKKR